MEFSRQESWNGLPFLSPKDLPNPGTEPGTPALQANSLLPEAPGKPSVRMKWSESRSVMSDSLQPHGLYSPLNSPGQNTGVGSLSLLQEIFPTQGLNPDLPHYRQILYQLSHKGSLRIPEWAAYPFSSGSSWSRNWNGVSCIVGGFFTNWALREATSEQQNPCFSLTAVTIRTDFCFWLQTQLLIHTMD